MEQFDVEQALEKEPFITLGFEEKNGFYVSDIPSALTGSCGHCSK